MTKTNVNGILLIDKPIGKTSHDIVDEVREIVNTREVGHIGTLDPAASGLLVFCIGKALKVVEFLNNLDKKYNVTIRLGITTNTDDAAGKTIGERHIAGITPDVVERAIAEFAGEILQKPPVYSAIKVDGKRLYRSALSGDVVETKERKVVIRNIEDIKTDIPLASFTVLCSKGTYIRSLARDIGEKLGCGGIVDTLRRLAVGHFRIEEAHKVEELNTENVGGAIIPIDTAISFMDAVEISDTERVRFCNGVIINTTYGGSGSVRVLNLDNLIGIGEVASNVLKPKKVLV